MASLRIMITNLPSDCEATRIRLYLVTSDGRFKTGKFLEELIDGRSSFEIQASQFITQEIQNSATNYDSIEVLFLQNEDVKNKEILKIP